MLENAQPRPVRGEHVLDRELRRAKIVAAERLAKAAAKRRDGWGCRFPDHKCRGPLEVAHIFIDKGLGGRRVGAINDTWNLMTLCAFTHRLGTPSIHSKDLKVDAETELGADAACSFWRRDEHGIWCCVGVEVRIGVLRKV